MNVAFAALAALLVAQGAEPISTGPSDKAARVETSDGAARVELPSAWKEKMSHVLRGFGLGWVASVLDSAVEAATEKAEPKAEDRISPLWHFPFWCGTYGPCLDDCRLGREWHPPLALPGRDPS